MDKLQINVVWNAGWAIPSYEIDAHYPAKWSNCTEFHHPVKTSENPFDVLLRNIQSLRAKGNNSIITW